MQKIDLQSNEQEEVDSENDGVDSDMGCSDDQPESRASLSSNIDWDDKAGLIHYFQKQKKIQEQQGFRPSEYFGAITVDKLEDGIDDSRIDELFSDCFGQKPKPKKKQAPPAEEK